MEVDILELPSHLDWYLWCLDFSFQSTSWETFTKLGARGLKAKTSSQRHWGSQTSPRQIRDGKKASSVNVFSNIAYNKLSFYASCKNGCCQFARRQKYTTGIQMRKYSFVTMWGWSIGMWQVHIVHLPYLESVNVHVFTPASFLTHSIFFPLTFTKDTLCKIRLN